MIYVTQGHENSIGTEIFIKSWLELDSKAQELFVFVTFKDSIIKTLNTIDVTYSFENNLIKINKNPLKIKLLTTSMFPQSTESLNYCLESLDFKHDILLTLPTSKDQLIFENEKAAGHTEFLRKKFDDPNIAMLFAADDSYFLLITDHIPLNEITKTITSQLIINKTTNAIEGIKKYFDNFDEVLFAGINPHCGENGILGNEDIIIHTAKEVLTKKFPEILFLGPYSGDTLHFYKKNIKQLRVYMYHDQGLPLFKELHGTIGLNISLGLPFLRMSVDHGTAFDLFGKNCANYQGSTYLLKKAIEAHSKINR